MTIWGYMDRKVFHLEEATEHGFTRKRQGTGLKRGAGKSYDDAHGSFLLKAVCCIHQTKTFI